MKANSPRFVIADNMLQPNLWPVAGMTGVFPFRP